MEFNSTQAAQTANYGRQAMNAFQTAVTIDNQQPKPEGTTFWFRWLVRIVAIVTGVRKIILIFFGLITPLLFVFLVAMICGVIGALSIKPTCIAAGVLTTYVNYFFILSINCLMDLFSFSTVFLAFQ